MHDTLIVGGGVAGLSLARSLERHGVHALVLERARGDGGRCATRRVDGRPVDHGLPFLHGRSDLFCAELASLDDATLIHEWPTVRDGDGSPCRPEAFTEAGHRAALAEGVNRFARHLARDLDIRVDARVVALTAPGTGNDRWTVTLESGDTLQARALALAVPPPNALDLLATAPALPAAVRGLLPLLELIRMVPCLTVIATYADGTAPPPWHISYPRTSAVVHSVIHDSSKRGAGAPLTLVIQARAAWSRAHQGDPADTWAEALLADAARLHGEWIARPLASQGHAWRRARVAPGAELIGPLSLQLDGGALLGCAGDGYHRAGGVEGAYLSGLQLASQWLALRSISPEPSQGVVRVPDSR